MSGTLDKLAVEQRAVYSKACERCNGDVQLGFDSDAGTYAKCLQCGALFYPDPPRSNETPQKEANPLNHLKYQ